MALELNTFKKKIKKIIGNKNISTNIYECKHTIQLCADKFVLDLLVLC